MDTNTNKIESPKKLSLQIATLINA